MRLVLALTLVALGSDALAALWCAQPLWVHEWGVHVIGDDKGAPPGLPDWFHHLGPQATQSNAVRGMPPDNGVRKLPILHFYSSRSWGQQVVPVGIEVGFTKGPAAAWYPQVDLLVPAATANSAVAQAARAALVAKREKRQNGSNEALPADPTRQLVWDRLDLTQKPQHGALDSALPWVKALRGFDGALWANGAYESERFVFYEGATREGTPLTLTRSPDWSPKRRAYVLTNKGTQPVHDVLVVHRDGEVFVVHASSIAANKSLTFVLEDNRVGPKDLVAATRGWLADALVDKAQEAPPKEYNWGTDCVMMRDPALPFEKAEGHRLYRQEVDALLDAWSARFFEQRGTTIVYREDLATLDEAMPLSIYTDMYNFVVLRRAGLALWEKVALP